MNMLTVGYKKERYTLIVEALFEEEKANIKGNFWLVLTPEAAEEIKRVCKKILESIRNS